MIPDARFSGWAFGRRTYLYRELDVIRYEKRFIYGTVICRPIIMALWQGKSRRKPTGGRRVFSRGKRRFEISREKQFTKIGRQSLKEYRGMGGSHKTGMLVAEYANVSDKKNNMVQKAKIISVAVNPADPNYVQLNIVNKGARIKTELGDAIVTSRPGQDGAINAVLVEKN